MAATESGIRGFQSPFEVAAPEGCDGWESMYPYYARFSEERRAAEEARGWFRDGMHFPEPMFPFDFVTADSPYLCLGQANTRIFAVPPALGIDHRVLYGWVYMSANGVTDAAEIGRRRRSSASARATTSSTGTSSTAAGRRRSRRRSPSSRRSRSPSCPSSRTRPS
jgi:pyruvate,water dikinase